VHPALLRIVRILAEIEAERLCSTSDEPKTDDELVDETVSEPVTESRTTA
jgi:hypothetical protein